MKKRVSTTTAGLVNDCLAAAVVIFTRHLLKTKSETDEKTVEVLLKYITIICNNSGAQKLPQDVPKMLLIMVRKSLEEESQLSEDLQCIILDYYPEMKEIGGVTNQTTLGLTYYPEMKEIEDQEVTNQTTLGFDLGSIIWNMELEFSDKGFENMSSVQRLAVTEGYILKKIKDKMEDLSAHRNPEAQLTISLESFNQKPGTSASQCQYRVSLRVSGDKLEGLERNSPQFKERCEFVQKLLKDIWVTKKIEAPESSGDETESGHAILVTIPTEKQVCSLDQPTFRLFCLTLFTLSNVLS